MFTNDVDLDKSKASLIQQYKNHIDKTCAPPPFFTFNMTIIFFNGVFRNDSDIKIVCNIKLLTFAFSRLSCDRYLELIIFCRDAETT
jgi:hypothetical protein